MIERRVLLGAWIALLGIGSFLRKGTAGMSRIGQPGLPDIEFEGRKYAQIMNGAALDLRQRTGYLSIIDMSSSTLVTIVRIYTVDVDESQEEDVEDVFFTSMDLDSESRQIIIENENGEAFAFNLNDWNVTNVE